MNTMLSNIKADRSRRKLILTSALNPQMDLAQFKSLTPEELFEKVANQSKEERAATMKAMIVALADGGTLYDALKKAIQILTSSIQGIQNSGGNLTETPTVTAAMYEGFNKKETEEKKPMASRPNKNFQAIIKEADWNTIIYYLILAGVIFGLWYVGDKYYPDPRNQGDPNQQNLSDFLSSLKQYLVLNGDKILVAGKSFIHSIAKMF